MRPKAIQVAQNTNTYDSNLHRVPHTSGFSRQDSTLSSSSSSYAKSSPNSQSPAISPTTSQLHSIPPPFLPSSLPLSREHYHNPHPLTSPSTTPSSTRKEQGSECLNFGLWVVGYFRWVFGGSIWCGRIGYGRVKYDTSSSGWGIEVCNKSASQKK